MGSDCLCITFLNYYKSMGRRMLWFGGSKKDKAINSWVKHDLWSLSLRFCLLFVEGGDVDGIISKHLGSIPCHSGEKGGWVSRRKMLRYEISLFSKKLHDFQSILSLEWHIISYGRQHHWFCFRRATISACAPSVGPLPWFQTVCSWPSLTQLTLIAPVFPLAEWEFT